MKKISLFMVSGILSVFLFLALTFIQGKMINNPPTQTVFVAEMDIQKEEKVTLEKLKKVEIPLFLTNAHTIINEAEFNDKYALADIYKGEILFKQKLADKESLKIIEVPDGFERIAVNIKAAYNAVAYQLKPKDRIHLYFTGRTSQIKDTFIKYGVPFSEVQNDNSLQTVKILENVEILGIYDEFGVSCENENFSNLDTVVLGVTKEKAELISNLREQGVFDITR